MLLNKHNLAIAELAEKTSSRSFATGILVSKDGTVVTNGQYLVKVSLPNQDQQFPQVARFTEAADVGDFILLAADAKEIAKALPKKTKIPVLSCAKIGEGNAIAVTDLDTSRVFQPKAIEARFPDYQRVMPTEAPAMRMVFDAGYMEKLCKSYSACGTAGAVIALDIFGPDRAMRLSGTCEETGQQWTALLMPCHGGSVTRDRDTSFDSAN
jgi:DNA polymerase III sliding clamp (beta) subunit (PCNA family)